MKAIRHARGLNKGLFGFILLALLLALALPIGNAGVAQAQPGAVTITDSFEDETRIAFKENVAVDTIAGQVELYPVLSATYGGSEKDYFYSVYADGNYIYAAGYTDSEGAGSDDTLLVKFNKADLSIAARKVYGESSYDYFHAVYADSDYIYAAGYTGSEGAGDSDALLVKFDKTDLSIDSRKVYGESSSDDCFRSVYADGNYIYAAGDTYSEGAGDYDALLVKFHKADLSIAARKVYGGSSGDRFWSVYADGNYIYAAGYTGSEGQGGSDALLVKFYKADLSIDSRKVYGGSKHDYFYSVYTDSNYIYAAGYTGSEGQGSDDALLVKFNISDLSIASKKVYGGGSSDYFYSVYTDSNYIYAAGNTDSEGEGEQDALLVKFNKSLPSGTYTGCGFTFQDSGLTLDDSGLTPNDSGLTPANSTLTPNNSNLTPADSTLTLAVCSISGPQPPVGVGGEAYPVNKLAILIPWIGLIAALLAGAAIVIRRRRAQG